MRGPLKNPKLQLFSLVVLALVVRVAFLDFPSLTSQESLYGARGAFLAHFGTDELGRSRPLVFNSNFDYQLPLTSYFSAVGILLLGKGDIGLRLPFVIIGTLLSLLIYLISKKINPNYSIYALLITALTPALIFISKVPNQAILFVFLTFLLFYLLIQNKLNYWLILLISFLTFFTSKNSWFIIPLLCFYTLYFVRPKFSNLSKQEKSSKETFIMTISIGILAVSSLIWFFRLDSVMRSFEENNFSIFQSISLENGINYLRGQGLQANWPALLSRLVFNKLTFLVVGLVEWSSYFNPAIFFGSFDPQGAYNFSGMGAFLKIMIIPLFVGLFNIIKNNDKEKYLLPVLLIVSFPSAFLFPDKNYELFYLSLPIFIIIAARGLYSIKHSVKYLIMLLLFFELFINFLVLDNVVTLEKSITDGSRPGWLVPILQEIDKYGSLRKIYVSEGLSRDVINHIMFYTKQNPPSDFKRVTDSYRFAFYEYGSYQIIVSSPKFIQCSPNDKVISLLTKNDLARIPPEVKYQEYKKYYDNFNNHRASLIMNQLCLD